MRLELQGKEIVKQLIRSTVIRISVAILIGTAIASFTAVSCAEDYTKDRSQNATSDFADRTHIVRYMKSNQASKRDIGSANILSGRVAICHIFCFDKESYWRPGERNRVLALMQQAFTFITKHSQAHQKRVQFVERVIGPVSVERTISTDSMADPIWTEDVIQLASHSTGQDLVTRLERETQADSVIICLHVNKSALSYNLAYYDNVAKKFDAERMVCFARYPDDRETAAATHAHEILHLFGAGDLYFPYDITSDRKLQAAALFPNDVMYRVDYNIGRLNVGPFTAFRVGWTNQLDAQLRIFEDD